jgi:hypothetical protein
MSEKIQYTDGMTWHENNNEIKEKGLAAFSFMTISDTTMKS